jgi:branched-chain amino acid transport system permease protein
MQYGLLFTQFISGLSYGMLIFIAAIGLSLVLGVAKVLNFAHGSFYMISAFVTYSIVTYFGSEPNSFWIALFVAPIVVAIFGLLCEIVLFRPIYSEELPYQLLLTYAIALILSDVQKMVWGPEMRVVWTPNILQGSMSVLGQNIGSYHLFLILLGPILFTILYFILNKTKLGNRLKAASVDRKMLSALGVDTGKLYSLTFVIGVSFAGIAGVLGAGLGPVMPGIDVDIILPCFIVVVIGGLGSLGGTLIGALLLGQVESFGILFFPRVSLAFTFILMAVVLIWRPWGLLGKEEFKTIT